MALAGGAEVGVGAEGAGAAEGSEGGVFRRVRWLHGCRIVPTRYPAINLFDRVADEADFEALYALEAMSNERARDELGQVERVAREDRIYGPGSGPVMAAFTHLNVLGSRFSAGHYGVFYAAHERATAVAETRYHHGQKAAVVDRKSTRLNSSHVD